MQKLQKPTETPVPKSVILNPMTDDPGPNPGKNKSTISIGLPNGEIWNRGFMDSEVYSNYWKEYEVSRVEPDTGDRVADDETDLCSFADWLFNRGVIG